MIIKAFLVGLTVLILTESCHQYSIERSNEWNYRLSIGRVKRSLQNESKISTVKCKRTPRLRKSNRSRRRTERETLPTPDYSKRVQELLTMLDEVEYQKKVMMRLEEISKQKRHQHYLRRKARLKSEKMPKRVLVSEINVTSTTPLSETAPPE